MDVSKNNGTPKWMVYNGKYPIKIHDLGVPLFLETPISGINLKMFRSNETSDLESPCGSLSPFGTSTFKIKISV